MSGRDLFRQRTNDWIPGIFRLYGFQAEQIRDGVMTVGVYYPSNGGPSTVATAINRSAVCPKSLQRCPKGRAVSVDAFGSRRHEAHDSALGMLLNSANQVSIVAIDAQTELVDGTETLGQAARIEQAVPPVLRRMVIDVPSRALDLQFGDLIELIFKLPQVSGLRVNLQQIPDTIESQHLETLLGFVPRNTRQNELVTVVALLNCSQPVI